MWGDHLHGQVTPALTKPSIHLPSRHYCQPERCHIPGTRQHNRASPTKPSYSRCDSVAICRDRSRQSRELLSQPSSLPLTRPDACLLPWAMLPRSRDSRFAASSSHGRQHPAALPSIPADPSIPVPPPPEREEKPFPGRGCSEGGIRRIPALPMEPLCASAAPDLSRRRRLAGS